MATAAALSAAVVEFLFTDRSKIKPIPFFNYAKAAATCAIASPMGYASLKYISFPLMILAKSSKPVPVMLIGVLFYKRVYSLTKYISVFLMCSGVCIYSASKSGKGGDSNVNIELVNQLFGIFLVGVNLAFDGYTNNEQDEIFKNGASSLQLMRSINIFQYIYLAIYLVIGLALFGSLSELSLSVQALMDSSEIRYDIFWFCVCASTGQLLIFIVMKQYGSLVWVTVSITRKLLTIMFSVLIFKHSMNPFQWLGMALAACGMILEVVGGYWDKSKSEV